MSREEAKAQFDQEAGEESTGYVTADDAQDAIDIMYDDIEHGEVALPIYEYAKVTDVQNIPSTWTRLCAVPVMKNEVGVYEPGFAVQWSSETADGLLYLRVSLDGNTWRSYTKRNTDVDNDQTFFYQFPLEWPSTDGLTVFLEAKKGGSDTGVLSVWYAQAWWRQVKRT